MASRIPDKDEMPNASKTSARANRKSLTEEKTPKKRANSGIMQPNDSDCVFGRGRCFQNHPGNQRLHRLIEAKLDQYAAAKDGIGKNAIIHGIVKAIQDGDGKEVPPGRFLKRGTTVVVTDDGRPVILWWEVDDRDAFEKVAHTLRSKIRLQHQDHSPRALANLAAFRAHQAAKTETPASDDRKMAPSIVPTPSPGMMPNTTSSSLSSAQEIETEIERCQTALTQGLDAMRQGQQNEGLIVPPQNLLGMSQIHHHQQQGEDQEIYQVLHHHRQLVLNAELLRQQSLQRELMIARQNRLALEKLLLSQPETPATPLLQGAHSNLHSNPFISFLSAFAPGFPHTQDNGIPLPFLPGQFGSGIP